MYCFDPRDYQPSKSGLTSKTGPFRATFLTQCLEDLRRKLRDLGSELIVRIGKPEEVGRGTKSESIIAFSDFMQSSITCRQMQTQHKTWC